jgi:hypothetical protein
MEYSQHLQSAGYTEARKDSCLKLVQIYKDDPLEFCLMAIATTLWRSTKYKPDIEMEYNWHEPAELFAILDDHLSNAGKLGRKGDIGRLDEILYSSYSDISAFYQILFLIRLHQPRVLIPTTEEAQDIGTGKAWRYMKADYLDQDHRNSTESNTENANQKIRAQQTLGTLFERFLDTARPTGSRANQIWLDRDQAQRKASSLFWAQMRSWHRQTLEHLSIGN